MNCDKSSKFSKIKRIAVIESTRVQYSNPLHVEMANFLFIRLYVPLYIVPWHYTLNDMHVFSEIQILLIYM